jgi:hypothetical protein
VIFHRLFVGHCSDDPLWKSPAAHRPTGGASRAGLAGRAAEIAEPILSLPQQFLHTNADELAPVAFLCLSLVVKPTIQVAGDDASWICG